MEDNSLPDAEANGWLADYHTVRAFWPQVQALDGQPMGREWMFADALFRVARLTLERHCVPAEAHTPAQKQVTTALEDVRQHEDLTRHDGFMHPYAPGNWFKIQACLGRVLPLVERLLLR